MVWHYESHIRMVVGIDVHVTTTPPFNPLHPYIGMIFGIVGYKCQCIVDQIPVSFQFACK